MPYNAPCNTKHKLEPSLIEPQIILDLLDAHGVQGSDQNHRVLACAIVHRVHPNQWHCSECDACQVPIVPLHAVLVHHVPPARETAFREDWGFDLHLGKTGELQRAAHGHVNWREFGAGESFSALSPTLV